MLKTLVQKFANSKAIKSSLAIFVASFITQAINFITTPIFTRLMSLEEYGLVAQFNSWDSIIAVFATLSLSAGVFQVAMNEYPSDRDRFTFSTIVLSNCATVVVFGVIFSFSDFFVPFFELPLNLIVLMFLYNLFYPAMSLWLARQRYEFRYKGVLIVSVGAALLSQCVSLFCVITLKGMNLGIVKLWSSRISMVAVGIVLYFLLAKKSNFSASFKYMKFALSFNLPLLVHYLAQYVLRSTDKIMITHYCGEGDTALYSLATTIANIATIVWSAINASLTPFIYDSLSDGKLKRINKVVLSVNSLFGICCVMVSFVGPEAIWILGSEKYMAGVNLIPPIAASCLLQAVYSNYASIAFYYHKRFSTSVMTVIAAITNLVLNIILIPKFGYIAAAYTTEISYLIYTFMHFINYRRIVGKDKIYNDSLNFLIVIIVTICCLLTGLLYDYTIIRYLLLCVMALMLIIFRKPIIKAIRMKND